MLVPISATRPIRGTGRARRARVTHWNHVTYATHLTPSTLLTHVWVILPLLSVGKATLKPAQSRDMKTQQSMPGMDSP